MPLLQLTIITTEKFLKMIQLVQINSFYFQFDRISFHNTDVVVKIGTVQVSVIQLQIFWLINYFEFHKIFVTMIVKLNLNFKFMIIVNLLTLSSIIKWKLTIV